jgi:hypothetical protein
MCCSATRAGLAVRALSQDRLNFITPPLPRPNSPPAGRATRLPTSDLQVHALQQELALLGSPLLAVPEAAELLLDHLHADVIG